MWDGRVTVLRCGLSRKSNRAPTETAPNEPAPSGGLFQPDIVFKQLGWSLRSDFTPSQTGALLASHRPPDVARPVISVLSSTPSPGFKGRNFITTTGSSATPHCFAADLPFGLSATCSAMARKQYGASPVTAPAPCRLHRPQSRHESEQVSDVALFCRLVRSCRRIRFAYATCRLLPVASFRPRRYQRHPCDSD